jgi:hypothetical protein
MKTASIALLNTVSAVIILDSLNAFHAAVFFLVAGQVPGTTTYLDGDTMMTIILAISGILVGRLSFQMYKYISKARWAQQQA